MGCNWRTPKLVNLPGPEWVHVWCVEQDSHGDPPQGYTQSLDAGEQERASRFHFDSDRLKFIHRRMVLRSLLGHYLHCAPHDIHYRSNEFGKLTLDERHNSDVQFNLSTSGEVSLIAFTLTRQIGIDIEWKRDDIDVGLIAERFFSTSERADLVGLPEDQQLQGFYHCWTRKEAVVKALGQGLSLPLDSFDVSLTPGEPARILNSRDAALTALGLMLQDISPAEDYAAALAIEGAGWQVEFWQYSDSIPLEY